ncbi:MAG: ATP-binding protein [Candidatus Micrarchaeia archaeon]
MAVPTTKEIMDYSPFNTGGFEETPKFRRNIYASLEKAAAGKYITALSGLRRVGKTVLLKQLLQKKGGAYFSFDEQKYWNTESLSAVIETFLDHGFSTIVLDEIGNVEDWAGTLKKHYDRGNAKFLISGSASLKIKKGRESLAGRMFEYHVPPFQFDEYLAKNGRAQAVSSIWKMRAHPGELPQFLMAGSFPEIHNEAPEAARKYVSTLADKAVFEDIPNRFGIEHRAKLADLLKYCATFSASLYSESGISSTLGIGRSAVSDYISYLGQSYLAGVLLEEGSLASALKKTKKLFISCPSLYWALSDSYSEGASAEVAVYDRLCAWGEMPKFYRDYQKREVDFIVRGVPMEVKFRNQIGAQDYSTLLYYMEKKKAAFGIMVTKSAFDEKKIEGRRILQIPLSVFLCAKDFSALLVA